MDTWTRISLQFTNLARAQATDTGVGVSTLNTSGGGAHLNVIELGNGTLPGLSLNTVLPVTDPVVSNGGIVCAPHCVRAHVAFPPLTWRAGPDLGPSRQRQSCCSRPGTVPSTGMLRICLRSSLCHQLPLAPARPSTAGAGGGVGGILTSGRSARSALVPLRSVTVRPSGLQPNHGAIQPSLEGASLTARCRHLVDGPAPVCCRSSLHHTATVGVPGNSDSRSVLPHSGPFIPSRASVRSLGRCRHGAAGRKRIRK